MFVGVIFSVMFKFFGHIHSVMLNWSNDYSSKQVVYFQFFRVSQSIHNIFSEYVLANKKPVILYMYVFLKNTVGIRLTALRLLETSS